MFRFGLFSARKTYCQSLVSVGLVRGMSNPIIAINQQIRAHSTTERLVLGPEATKSIKTQKISQNDVDDRGFAYGGVILAWMDACAGTSANQFSGVPCVTASVDAVHFVSPIRISDVAILTAVVNRSWNTSFELGIQIEAEDVFTGKRRLCSYATTTFVAMKDGKPMVVPQLTPTTRAEIRRWELADSRREQRREQQRITQQQHGYPLRSLIPYDNRLSQPPAYMVANGTPASLSPGDCYTRTFEWVFTQHVNPLNICFGGNIMHWMHFCASITAHRHCRRHLLLASIDRLQFVNSVLVGDIITLRSVVSQTFRSSLEIYMTVESHNTCDRTVRRMSNEAYMTFVAVDHLGEGLKVPDLRPETDEERYFASTAHERRANRIAERDLLDQEYE
ncbi:HotDog domain-containing protein [Syncephalis fuscata]|nr:HotDog domain-containing protein [Syncephalis fuscata]